MSQGAADAAPLHAAPATSAANELAVAHAMTAPETAAPSEALSRLLLHGGDDDATAAPPQQAAVPARSAPTTAAHATAQQQQPQPPAQQQQHRRRLHRLDHAARTYAGLAMALVTPVTITMVIIVWAVQSLGPVDNVNQVGSGGGGGGGAPTASSAEPAFVVVKESSDRSTGENISGALLNALIVVAAITVITFVMVILYKYGYERILYGWLGLSAALIFFFLAGLFLDLIAVRYQIPYDLVMYGVWVWNFGCVGLVSVFYLGHPMLAQAYLIVVSVVAAWGLSQTPEWTTWALLLFVAVYDILAVLCPGGPLNLLVRAAQERQAPIPGFIYDSDAGPAIEMTGPARAPFPTPPNQPPQQQQRQQEVVQQPQPQPQHQEPATVVKGVVVVDAARNEGASPAPHNPLDIDALLVADGGSRGARAGASSSGAAAPAAAAVAAEAPPPTPIVEGTVIASPVAAQRAAPPPLPSQEQQQQQHSPPRRARGDDDEDDDPFEAAHNASAFKLGLGDFIFYSVLVGRAALTFRAGTQTPWLICYVCIIGGMGATLASLLFLRGKVPALPALPFSIFAAAIAFFITRYATLPYWDFQTLYAMTP
jgi:hypothetical protein